MWESNRNKMNKTAADVAADVIEALMCRLSERGKAKMDLVKDTLDHCRFSFTAIIQKNTDDVTAEKDDEIKQLKQQLADATKPESKKSMYPHPYENVLDANDSAGEAVIDEAVKPVCETCEGTGKEELPDPASGRTTGEWTRLCPDCSEATKPEEK